MPYTGDTAVNTLDRTFELEAGTDSKLVHT